MRRLLGSPQRREQPLRSFVLTCLRRQSGGETRVTAEYPVVQLPARSLWCKQIPLDVESVQLGHQRHMVEKLLETRKYYQYPSISAPQIGWNTAAFVLFDETVFINPRIVCASEQECLAWEPCASCAFMMHFIRRPREVSLEYYDQQGKLQRRSFDKMRARMIFHEMDHMDGILFTRRIPDTHHVVPLDGFNTMSDWPDDYPSLEARSTFLYSTFTPPYFFETDDVSDANLLDRKFEDGIYPGHEYDTVIRVNSTVHIDTQRELWRNAKAKQNDFTMPDATADESENAKKTS